MQAVVATILLVCAIASFSFALYLKLSLLRRATRPPHSGFHWKSLFKNGLLQWKLPRFLPEGPGHVLIFWGFLVLVINTIIIIGRGFSPQFNLLVFDPDTPLGAAYAVLRDYTSVAVLIVTILFMANRLLRRPQRMTLNAEGLLILCMITLIMVGDLLYWSFHQSSSPDAWHAPGSALLQWITQGTSQDTRAVLSAIGFWLHFVLVLVFLNLLPHGKHFHVITALPNVWLGRATPAGTLPLDANVERAINQMESDDSDVGSDETEDDDAPLGLADFTDFTWKDYLDMYSCTHCGRCSARCPATQSNKSLSPKRSMVEMSKHLHQISNRRAQPISPVSPELIPDDDVFACTTCLSCETECPVDNSFVDKFVRLRRHLVEEQGTLPRSLATMLRGMENNGNPWNLAAGKKDAWHHDLDARAFDPSCTYLLYVGCAAAFDDKAQNIARSMVQLLNRAGVSYGILGGDEPCCGETARRAGGESTFRFMAEETKALLDQTGVKQIITLCPHCYNTFANEYPALGANFTVTHHSTLLNQLLESGALTTQAPSAQTVVYHDPCYLGRYNDQYAAPRAIIQRLAHPIDIDRSRDTAMCCGAGGARFFMDEPKAQRVNDLRYEQLKASGADVLCTACPYCKSMLSDTAADHTAPMQQKDIAELLWEQLETS